MTDQRKKLGNFGEQAAAAFLVRQGMQLVAQQWRCEYGELDLVLRDGTTLVFAEVRTRRAGLPGSAEESVNHRKQQRLVALGYAYLAAHSFADGTPWRIDVIAVDIDRRGRVARLAHLRDAVGE